MPTETRNFQMDPALLYSVIQRQAGSLEKALLEGVMNSVDAGASRCDILVEELDEGQTIAALEDDGRGFRDRQEIEKYFETFGTPHEEGDAYYGRFRMGRGQMFAYGRNSWASGQFRMDVDIKNQGLSYELEVLDEPQPGCVILIELYKPLDEWNRKRLARELQPWVAWMPIDVYYNGVLVSHRPEEAEWEHETDDCWFNPDENGGSLHVYNRGAFVMSVPSYRFGVGGTIISKLPLEVNFARNDIMSGCKVWNRMQNLIRRVMGQGLGHKKNLNDDERRSLIAQIRDGEVRLSAYPDAPLFEDWNHKYWSLNRLRGQRKFKAWTVAGPKETRADYLMNHRLALVFSEATVSRFAGGKLEVFASLLDDNRVRGMKQVDLEPLVRDINQAFSILPTKDLSPKKLAYLRIAERLASHVLPHDLSRMPVDPRTIVLGEKVQPDGTQGWTDGMTYIALPVDRAEAFQARLQDLVLLARILLHEYCHDAPSSEAHNHTPFFYEQFHDNSWRIALAVERTLPYVASTYAKLELKVPRPFTKMCQLTDDEQS